jgi:cytochrome c
MGFKVYAAVLVLAFSAGAARAAVVDPSLGGPGSAAHGEVLFKQRCSTCHQADKTGKNGVGPLLYGAFGRIAGKEPGFTYSDNLKAATFTWTPDKLNQWIQKPTSLVPGAKMFLPPVAAPQDRADIIAFLEAHSTNVVKTANETPAAASTTKKAKKTG